MVIITNNFPPIRLALQMLVMVSLWSSDHSAAADNFPVALPNCNDSCGGVTIPYPFGIGLRCSHNASFNIICSNNYNPPRPLLPTLVWSELDVKYHVYASPPPYAHRDIGSLVINISIGTTSSPPSISIAGSWDQLQLSGEGLYATKNLNMKGTPYLLPATRNALVVGGCSGGAVLVTDGRNMTVGGCATVCVPVNSTARSNRDVSNCYGIECCQSAIPTSVDRVKVDFLNLLRKNDSGTESVTAAVIDLAYLANAGKVDRDLAVFEEAPTLLEWRVSDLEVGSAGYSNSSCSKQVDGGYRCRCRSDYYHGNPYLPNGCRVIKECKQCPNDCNSIGYKKFACPPPPSGNNIESKLVLALGITLATTLLLIILSGMYQFLKIRKENMNKRHNFKRNGGLLLQQQLCATNTSIEGTRVFASAELEKATDNFSDSRVLGRGGQGTVYKGMLPDGKIVAIKKSKKVSEKQLEQFINEVVILSQVTHRHVVKLLGCCLETDVPLLVYEHIPNGSLYQHIHNPSEEFFVTWKMRLQIAVDSSEALAHLHSSSFSPIFHRDIKTSNILLDERYRAKLSDFGTSKMLSIDQTHFNTVVQGTFGYMDPEFLQSNNYTEKSDVYSFGIVLLELLTGKKAIYSEGYDGAKSLAVEFTIAVQSSHLFDMVDDLVLQEAQRNEIESVADLAIRCLNLNGKERPTMKEVAITLHMINLQNFTTVTSKQSFGTKGEFDQNWNTGGGSSCTYTWSSYGPR